MARQPSQTFENHARYVPLYHFVLSTLLLVLLGWAIRDLIARPSAAAVFQLLLVVAVILVAFFARGFALAAQDRVIRLEMKLRMQGVTPQLMPRFGDLSVAQLTALRFAGDAELPGLVQQVLDGRLSAGVDIKRQIKDWQPDHLRV